MSATVWSSRRNVARPTRADVRWQRWWLVIPVLVALCALMVLVSVMFGVGSVTLSPFNVWQSLTAPETAGRLANVATNARLPRALLGLGVGAALGTAGALLQALYRNPLADPSITGVTQGAVTAAVFWLTFGPPVQPGHVSIVLPLVAAIGASSTAGITWGVTRLAGRVEPVRLLLMGVLVGGVLGAGTSLCLLMAGDDAGTLINWLSGSLASATWEKLRLFLGAVGITSPLVLMAIPRANVLQFGDEVATGLGQNVTVARGIVLVASCILTAAAVCIVGGIGFVGLIAPHLLRWLVGSDLRRLVPAAALGGGALVVVADFIARNLRPVDFSAVLQIPLNTTSLPVGVYLALLGAPFFLFLLRRTHT